MAWVQRFRRTTRRERLKDGRTALKRASSEGALSYSLLDIGDDREVLGINFSRWIVTAIQERVGADELRAALEALYQGQDPPGDVFELALAVVEQYIKRTNQPSPEGFHKELAARLNQPLERLVVPSAYRSKDRATYDDADVEQALQDIKLLFRAEHVVLLLDALRPWETFLGLVGESFELAYHNMVETIREVQTDKDEKKELALSVLNAVVFAGLSALAVTGVGLIPAVAAAAEATTFLAKAGGELATRSAEAFVQLSTEKATRSGWLHRKLDDLMHRPADAHLREVDLRKFRARMIGVISQVRAAALTIADLTTDRDVYMLLDYVQFQAARGFKVGLKTHPRDVGDGADARLEVGEQQDAVREKKRGQPGSTPRPLAGVELVRKTRHTLEKAFEYWFELLLAQMQFPEQLAAIRADQESSLDFMAQRLELEMWCQWIKGTLDTKQDVRIRQYVYDLVCEAAQLAAQLPPTAETQDYLAWLQRGANLERSISRLRRWFGKPTDRTYPSSAAFNTWAGDSVEWNPLLLAPRDPVPTRPRSRALKQP